MTPSLPCRRALAVALMIVGWICPLAPQVVVAAESYAIRRSTPYKSGDRWRAEISVIKETTGQVTVSGKQRKLEERETTQLTALVTVTAVDELGYATKWTARIVRFERAERGKRKQALLRPGDEIHFARRGDQLLFEFADGGPVPQPGDEIRRYLSLATHLDDAPLEPPQAVPLGNRWKSDTRAMKSVILAKGPPQLREFPDVFEIKAEGKLAETVETNPSNRNTPTITVSFQTQLRLTKPLEQPNQYLDEMKSLTEETFVFPADYRSDFLSKKTVETESMLTAGKGSTPDLNIEMVTTTIERRNYMDFKGGGVRPWRAVEPREAATSWQNALLVGFDFQPDSFSGSGKTLRAKAFGSAAGPTRVKHSGFTAGPVGSALKFDGKDDHLNLEKTQTEIRKGLEALTIAAWVRSDSTKVQFLFDIGSYAPASVSLLLYDNKLRFTLPPKAGGVILECPLRPREFTHVVVVWDGRSQKAYVNGVLVAEKETTKLARIDGAAVSDLPCFVGGQSKTDRRKERYFTGAIDELGVWSRAFDESQVAEIYRRGQSGQSLFAD